MVLVLTKTDLRPVSDLTEEDKQLIESIRKEYDATILDMSNITGDGIFQVKSTACDILQKYRESLSKDVTTGGLV